MWYLSPSMLAWASSLFLLRACCQLFPVYSSGRLSQDALGSALGLPVCMLSCLSGVLFGFLHFGVMVAPAMTGSVNKVLLQQITLDESSSELTYRKQQTICQIIAGTSHTEVSLTAMAVSRSVYAPPAEGGFLYLTHSQWESLKEEHEIPKRSFCLHTQWRGFHIGSEFTSSAHTANRRITDPPGAKQNVNVEAMSRMFMKAAEAP